MKLQGAILDNRPLEERLKDFSRDEILLPGAGVPYTNERPLRLKATVYNQRATDSCVAHALLTQLEYEGLLKESASQLQLYRKRANYAGSGANGVDLYGKVKQGLTRYSDSPTPTTATEAYANALRLLVGSDLTHPFKYFSYSDAYSPNKALYEYIPQDVHSGKAVVVFIHATNAEWRKEWVEPTDRVDLWTAPVRHAVVLVPKGDFTDSRGKRWLTVHDSAHFGGYSKRFISEEFLEKRAYWGAIVVAEGKTEPVETKPVLPTTPVSLGQRSVAVSNLQSFLISKGFLEPQYQTGYYGALTARAVLWYQLYHHKKFTDTIPELLSLKGHWWGAQSINSLKK